MDCCFTEEQVLLRESVQKLMAKHCPPAVMRQIDHEKRYPYELYDAWVEAGLIGMPFAEAYGGLAGGAVDSCIIMEEIARVSADLSMMIGGSIFCGLNIQRKGSEEQKRYWLPKLIKGEIKMSISMSEPDAGSDVGAMRTTAVRDGDHYVINGQKLWATGAGAKGSVINMYVKTDPKAHYRQGLSLFLIDNNTPGLELRKLDMLGRYCTGTYEIFLKDVRVPADRLIGGEEGHGLQHALSGLELGRINVAARGVGIAQAALDHSLRYAQQRHTFGKPIAQHQAIQLKLADMATRTEAARLLTRRAAEMYDRGDRCDMEAGMAKLFATEAALENATEAMRVHGGYGYSTEFPVERLYHDAPLLVIGEGTNELQRIIIARQLVARNPV